MELERMVQVTSIQIDLQDLIIASEWVSAGEGMGIDCAAYVSRETGKIYWSGEGIDEALPDDVDDGTRYVAVPRKRDFDLGGALALRFVEENLPESYERIRQFFRKRGAYSRLQAELQRVGQLDAWLAYEQQAIEKALREWGVEHGFVLS
jgi:hypothetical protein